MDADKLVKMANEIAAFFDADPDRAVALAGIAGHLKRFWDPRMRRELLRWQDDHAGEGLKDSVRDAIAAHRDKLLGGV
jgi:formate dehydrogenase subunit delta